MNFLTSVGQEMASHAAQSGEGHPPLPDIEGLAGGIFSAQNGEILPMLYQVLPDGQEDEEAADYTSFIALLKRIFDEKGPQERTDEIINEIAEHPRFPNALIALAGGDPETFWNTIYALRENGNVEITIPLIAKDGMDSFALLTGCVRFLVSGSGPCDIHPCRYFEALVECFEEEEFQIFSRALIQNLSFDELGKALYLADEEATAAQITSLVVEFCLESQDYPRPLMQLIQLVANATIEDESKYPPEFLIQLLSYGQAQKISRVVLKNSNQLTFDAFTIVLWCLPKRELSWYLSRFSLQEHADRYANLLSALIRLEKKVDERIGYVKTFIKELPEDDLLLLMNLLLEQRSPAIPYLCPAMGQEAFQVFSMVFEPAFRTNLLRCAIEGDVKRSRKIIDALGEDPDKANLLCNVAVMDIVSQNLTRVGAEQVATFATLRDFSNCIQEGLEANDLDQKMVNLHADFERIPPLHLAIAMRDASLRASFLATIRYMTEEQFKAFLQQVPKGEEITILDELLARGTTDQMMVALSEIPLEVADLYLRAKCEEMEHEFEMISARRKEIRQKFAFFLQEEFQKHPNFRQEFEEITEMCSGLQPMIVSMLAPSRLAIGKTANVLFEQCDIEDPQYLDRIQNILRRSKKYAEELSGPEGWFRKLAAINPSRQSQAASSVQVDFRIEMVPEKVRQSSGITLQMLKDRGLCYIQDFAHLGIDLAGKQTLGQKDIRLLRKYLQQEGDLAAIWQFFRSKSMGSTGDLFTAMIVEKKEDLLELKALAARLGFT